MLLGMGAGVLILLGITGVASALVNNEVLDIGWMNYLAALTLVVSSVSAGWIGSKCSLPWVGAMAAGGGLWLFLLAVNLLLYGRGLHGVGATTLAIAGGSAVPPIFSGGKKQGRKRGRRFAYR